MNKKEVRRVAKDYCHELRLYYQRLLPGYGIASIHQFRVNYKKLRAFLRMMRGPETITGQLPVTKKLKSTYRLCGGIRDLQLHRQQIQHAYRSRQKKPQTYLLQLQQKTAGYKKELRTIFSETTMDAGIEKVIGSLPGSFSKKSLRRYIQQQWDAVQQLIDSRHFTDANMHRIRKLLKDLYYNMSALDEGSIVVKNGKRKTIFSLKSFDALLNQLGKFQDLTTEIRLLGVFQLKGLPAAEQKELEWLRATCLVQKNQLKRNLVEQLKTDYASK
ncbi:MAG TPA: CHAD domain-containing protein [Sediminibacterium sp.]|nr:CHAD domain-containing protein [Sediminibacterium sp.]